MSVQNLPITTAKSLTACSSNKWTSVGTGFNGAVYALAKVGNYLYAGGAFTQIINGPPASNLAKWDGTAWLPVDLGVSGANGVDGTVQVLYASGNTLYIGGQFTHAGGNSIGANNVVAWNGSTWNTLGHGVQGTGGIV